MTRGMALVLGAFVLWGCDKGKPPSDPCSQEALGIATAKQLVEWNPPSSCTVHLAQSTTAVVRGEADVAKAFDCPASALGIDFAKYAVIVAPRFLTEAMSGMEAFDDGKTVTLVTRFLRPCPDGSHPLMDNQTYVYVIANGERAIVERSCTRDKKCPAP